VVIEMAGETTDFGQVQGTQLLNGSPHDRTAGEQPAERGFDHVVIARRGDAHERLRIAQLPAAVRDYAS
jgi:hypothetical protein